MIKSGQVRIQFGNRTLTELGPDSIFGEMALIDNESRSATATAITDVEIVPVSERQFLLLDSQTPYFALKVMRVLAQRLRATNKTFGEHVSLWRCESGLDRLVAAVAGTTPGLGPSRRFARATIRSLSVQSGHHTIRRRSELG